MKGRSLAKTLMLGKTEGKEEKGVAEDKMVDSITNSVDMILHPVSGHRNVAMPAVKPGVMIHSQASTLPFPIPGRKE